jgi:hypothetical protein
MPEESKNGTSTNGDAGSTNPNTAATATTQSNNGSRQSNQPPASSAASRPKTTIGNMF